jgi:hypothetical protein
LLSIADARPVHGQDFHPPTQQAGFWDSDQRTQAGVAVQMLTQSNPYMMALVRIQARHNLIWREQAYDPSRGAPELDPARLLLIKDRTTMPDFRGREPELRTKVELATYDLFCRALLFAHDTPLEAFEKSAENNESVTFADLYRSKDPSSPYRGKVIPIEGKLRRLRRTIAPRTLKEHGIHHVYEGWIEGPTKNAPLFWVVVPSQPEDKDGLLKPAEEMNRPVKFYGYFFKVVPYPAQIGTGENFKTVERYAPLLIGPTLILTTAPTIPDTDENLAAPMSALVLTILAAFGSFALLVIVGLTWWFHRGDRHFRARLHQFHSDRALAGFEEGPDQDMIHTSDDDRAKG